MRSHFDNRYFPHIHQGTVIFCSVWLVTGFLKLFEINNKYGALTGLFLGAGWGYLSARLLPKERRISRQDSLY
jgi:hypothetical protein